MIEVKLTKEDLIRARKEGLGVIIKDHKVYLWGELVLNFLQAKDLNVFVPHYKFLDAIVRNKNRFMVDNVLIFMRADKRGIREWNVWKDEVWTDEVWKRAYDPDEAQLHWDEPTDIYDRVRGVEQLLNVLAEQE